MLRQGLRGCFKPPWRRINHVVIQNFGLMVPQIYISLYLHIRVCTIFVNLKLKAAIEPAHKRTTYWNALYRVYRDICDTYHGTKCVLNISYIIAIHLPLSIYISIESLVSYLDLTGIKSWRD